MTELQMYLYGVLGVVTAIFCIYVIGCIVFDILDGDL